MLADQFHEAAAAAKNTHAVDEIARLTWRAHAEGRLDYSEAEAVGEALAARGGRLRLGWAFPPRRPCSRSCARPGPRRAARIGAARSNRRRAKP